ncbi:MAG: 50S ribosomal protein L10, partial [Verrucomicrobiota bacterium]
MKELKDIVIKDLLERINASPYLIVVEYAGMTVPEFEELRGQLRDQQARLEVAKNSFVKRAAAEAELPEEINATLLGQNAVVTGAQDICAAAKVIKDFHKKTEKAAVRSGVLD